VSHLQTIDKAGLKPFRHHDQEYAQELRMVPWGGQVIGFDEYGNKILEEDSVGDEINWFLWKRSSRKTSGWSMAWPAIVGGGAGGGGGGGQEENHAGFTFEGVETDFSAGGPEAGASFPGVRTDFSVGGQIGRASCRERV